MNAPIENVILEFSNPMHIPAIAKHALDIRESDPERAVALHLQIVDFVTKDDVYVNVIETDLGNGLIVPAFSVAAYAAGRGLNDIPISTADAQPWNEISYFDAYQVCDEAGRPMISVPQAVAIAKQIVEQDENWTGGKVGEGHVYMGLHKSTVSGPQPGSYESPNAEERRWHVLANGQKIFDMSGNLLQFMQDTLHGDEKGLVGPNGLPADSPLLTLPPYPSREKGMGWRPDDELAGWAGRALIRGGDWGSGARAGVFYLSRYGPRGDWSGVGFRSTKPMVADHGSPVAA